MKIPDDQQFTTPIGLRFNLTMPVAFRNHLKAKGIDIKPGEMVTLAFIDKSNGGGTHQVELDIEEAGGTRAKGKKESSRDQK